MIAESRPENRFLLCDWPEAAQIQQPALDNAQWQAELDAHYSDHAVAAEAGTGGPPIGPGRYTLTYAEALSWLRRRWSRRRVAPAGRQPRQRESAASSDRDEIRQRLDEARAPPERKRARLTGNAPENISQPSTSAPYARSLPRAIIPPAWVPVGLVVARLVARLGGAA